MAYNSVGSKFFIKIISVALCALSIVGCSEVDDTLGLEFVPNDQKMKVCSGTFSGIDCYLIQDSLPSSNLGVAFFGTVQSATFGVTEASSVLQFLPGGFKDADAGFGYLPVADTLKLYWDRKTVNGKEKKYSAGNGQLFYIYESKERLIMDSTYYSEFNVDRTLTGDPIFEFKYTDTTSNYMILKPLGGKGGVGEKFLQSLVDVTKNVYESDTAFHRVFKGLYIAPAPSSDKDMQIFSAGLENSHLQLVAHNHDKNKVVGNTPDANGADNKDTIRMAYYFDDGQYSTNTSVNKFVHDYAGTTFGANIAKDTTNLKNQVTTAYVQSLAGVSTYLRFTDKFVEDLVAAKKNADTLYKSMVINRAEIRFYLDDAVNIPLQYNNAPKRLGMYYNYMKFKSMPGYEYQYEQQGSVFDYGGYLDRSLGCYVMDIRDYVQKLMIDPTTQKTIYLAPDVSMTYVFGEVALKAPSDVAVDNKRIEVKLTYTLVK